MDPDLRKLIEADRAAQGALEALLERAITLIVRSEQASSAHRLSQTQLEQLQNVEQERRDTYKRANEDVETAGTALTRHRQEHEKLAESLEDAIAKPTGETPSILAQFTSSASELGALQLRLELAHAALSDAKQKLGGMESAIARAQEEVADWDQKLAGLAAAQDKLAAERNEAARRRDETRAAVDNALAQPAPAPQPAPIQLNSEVLRLLSGAPRTKPNDFLTITMRDTPFASVVQSALETLVSAEQWKQRHNRLRDELVGLGVASNIEKVTQKINRYRLSPIRRAVLARVYPDLLADRLLNHGGGNLKRAKDTSGLAQTVLADLEKEKGTLDAFAGLLADRAAEVLGLAIHLPTARETLKARIRGSL